MRRAWFGGKREAIQDQYFRESLDPQVWTEGDAEDWHTCWYTGMPKPAVFEQLDRTKTINHIPGNNSLTVKSNLHATLNVLRERLIAQEGPDSERVRRLRFFPAIYSMPRDYHALLAAATGDPDRRWILKPKNGARGKDIRMVKDVATVPTGDRWMVQEYLDRPHTMFGRKYVLRLYVLITSVEPLRVYLYREGSAKLASADYDEGDLDNLYAHLTNPDVNATNDASTSPVVFVNLDQYREWLREQGHDDALLFRRLRELVVLTALGAREKMRDRTQAVAADTSGCYELLGLDCLVDDELNPWLLECNLSPSLETCAAPEDGGDTEARNKREMIEDLVRLLRLNEGPLELPDSSPRERVIAEAEAERDRAGGWTRVFPAEDAAEYLPFFPLPRLADMVLAEHACGQALARPQLRPRDTAEIIADNRLSLYNQRTQTLYTPNESAAWIWLQAVDGADPDRIAAELAAARGGRASDPDWATRQEVWDVLADWAATGLLVQGSATSAAAGESSPPASRARTNDTACEQDLDLGSTRLRVRLPESGLHERLRAAFAPVLATTSADNPTELRVSRMTQGFALARGDELLASGLPLGEVVPRIRRAVRSELARATGRSLFPGALVPLDAAGNAAWIVPEQNHHYMDAARQLATRFRGTFSGGVQLQDTGKAESPQLPLAVTSPADAAPGRFQHGQGVDKAYYLVPANADAGSFDIGAVILPDGSDGTAEPRELSVHTVLPTLINAAAAAGNDGLDADTVSQLAEWLEQRPLFGIPADAEGPAMDAVATRLQRAGEKVNEPG